MMHSRKVLLLLFLFTCGFSPCTSLSQDTKSTSGLFKNEIRNSFTFRPNGRVKVHEQKELILELTYNQRLLIDIDLLKAIGLERIDDVEVKARELVTNARKFGRERSGARGKKEKQQVVDDWNECLDQFVSDVDELTTPDEDEILADCATAAEFFELGYTDFLKKHSPDFTEISNDSVESLHNEVSKIEKEVWGKLLSTMDVSRRPEFELALNDGLPNRTPSLSVLWRSLRSLERGDKLTSAENVRLPVFAVKSGRLIPTSHHPYPATTELVTVMGLISKGHPDEELIKNCMQEMFMAHFAIQTKYQAKRAEFRGIKEAIKKLNREKTREQTESRDEYFNRLPELVKSRIRQATIVSDYQRHGIQFAWFSPKNHELIEMPPDEDDLSCLRENAKEAREHLEERVHQLFKEFILENLTRHFEPRSAKIRWVYRKYPLQIPPIELIGIKREKGDYRQQK